MSAGPSLADEAAWQEFRHLYPITSKLAYLNNASMGPLPLPVRRALESHLDRWQEEHLGASITIDFSEPLRGKVARFLSAAPEEIAFTPGVTDGIFRAASLVRPGRGENVVLPVNEFPSAVYPWRRYEKEGAEIRFAGPPRGPVTEQHLMEACDGATRAVCASLVSFADGTRIDLAPLSSFCRQRGIALVIDAMQAAGALALDLRATPVDFLAFGPVKWIPAPVGAGVLYVRHGWEERAEGRWLGWRSVRRHELCELLRYDLDPYPGARRLDGGSPVFFSQVGLEAALDLFLAIGTRRIEERVLRLAERVAALLAEEGFENVWPREGKRRSGIVVCDLPGSPDPLDAGRLVDRMAGEGVIVAERNGRIRVSAHAFSDDSDLERLRAALRGRDRTVRNR